MANRRTFSSHHRPAHFRDSGARYKPTDLFTLTLLLSVC